MIQYIFYIQIIKNSRDLFHQAQSGIYKYKSGTTFLSKIFFYIKENLKEHWSGPVSTKWERRFQVKQDGFRKAHMK